MNEATRSGETAEQMTAVMPTSIAARPTATRTNPPATTASRGTPPAVAAASAKDSG